MLFEKNFKNVKELYNAAICLDPLPPSYAVVFVYNEESLVEDIEHYSECITSIEKDMIVNSFRKSAQWVYSISGEDDFIDKIAKLKKKHQHIFVYSMAQNIAGIGRRSLIPLLCDYYKVHNLGSDFFASTLGGNKKLMYKLITPYVSGNIPFTIYVDQNSNLKDVLEQIEPGTYIVKPNDESASIGVKKIDISKENAEDVLFHLANYKEAYPNFCIQEYIDGVEIEVPLLFYKQEYYCPGCVEIKPFSSSGYLDYDTVYMDAYSFQEYTGELSKKLIECSEKVATALGFETICRVDFRIKDKIPYIIDIGPNPTVSYHSSTNYIFRKRFGTESAIYQLLLFISLSNAALLEPSFDKPE